MKLVINSCFGGFGLSHKAVMRYAEIKGFSLWPWLGKIARDVYKDQAKIGNDNIPHHYSTVEVATDVDEAPNDTYFTDRDIARDDPALIQVVEEMGEGVSGRYAELKIVEIPDDVGWQIAEYDGAEHVAEKHRTWG